MKIMNIMNFVRQCDPRLENSEEKLYNATKRELELVREFGFKNTFLLQYDAVIDPRYQKLFKENIDDNMELGLWLEIVEPLVKAVGLPWRGRPGWKWDWYVVPGFSMAYTPEERMRIIDECMEKFREVFGFYPATVCSWLLDTVTANYLSDKYDIKFMGICRDQVNTDAYTLIGGYFNGGYYPSRKNIFTPAQTEANRLKSPVFRLLGPDPIHNYDGKKYMFDPATNYCFTENDDTHSVWTMEAVWLDDRSYPIFDWLMRTYYKNESMGFAYSQIGQENSFGYTDFIPTLRKQFEALRAYSDVSVMTMKETGEWFASAYKDTPSTALVATDCWNRGSDVQAACYDGKNYCANIMRVKNRLFIRSLYLFDEETPEHYLTTPATNWDATYENLPVIDTLRGDDGGFELDDAADKFTVSLDGDNLIISWNHGSVVFTPEKLIIKAPIAVFHTDKHPALVRYLMGGIMLEYKNARYLLSSDRRFTDCESGFCINETSFTLIPERRHPFIVKECLETEHLMLRKAKETDLEAIFKNVWSDERLAKYMLWKPTQDLDEAKKRLERTRLYHNEQHAFFVCLRETDEPIGFAGCYESAYGVYEESGICIARAHQGKGYGKELLTALTDFAFSELGASKFKYGCFKENEISRRLALSLGFKYTGSHSITRGDGKTFTCEEYELER